MSTVNISSGASLLGLRRLKTLVTHGLLALLLLGCSKHPTSEAPKPPAIVPVSPPKQYQKTIILPSGAGPELARAAADLQKYLSSVTGQPFRIEPHAERGIFLLRSDSPDAPADLVERARGCGAHGFVSRDVGDGRLLIVADTDAGLAFGIYRYLADLGVHFYFPNERWTIVPARQDIEQRVDANVKPAFRLRQFQGTGGLGRGLAVDPRGELEARWNAWKLRNGFGEEFHLDGHSGESFNVRNKQELEAHPEYLARVGGKRAVWSKTAKLDPSNPAAVDLFVRDRLDAYRTKRARDPNGSGSFAVSVEPADGGGHCDSEECEQLGSVSDREFHVANAVARALVREFPEAKASLFAYNLHADVPNIPIDRNVYVTLVPYAFRRDGSDPEEFIQAWSKKKSPLSIYDYWSIPDWSADLPSFDYRTTPAKKLRFWHQQQVEGFLGESTYSAGAMGLAWYIAARLMWNTEANSKTLEDEFFRESFENAAPPMRRMLERWAGGFTLTRLEIRASFSDISAAFKLARSPAVRGRLTDYAAYLQYLRLRADWTNAGAAVKLAAKRALVHHLWRAYDTTMLDTYRLQHLLLRRDAELAAELNPTDASLSIWRTLAPITEGVAQKWIDSALVEVPEIGVVPRAYVGPLSRLPASASSGSPNVRPGGIPLTIVGSHKISLHVPQPSRLVTVEVYSVAGGSVRLLDSTQRQLQTLELAASDQPEKITMDLASGDYQLVIRAPKLSKVGVSCSAGVEVEFDELRVPKGVTIPPLYFYLPPSQSALALYDPIALPEGSGVLVRDSSGAVVPLERYDGGHLLVARAAPDERGRVWSLERAISPDATLRLLNAPQRFALDPRALRVPASALAR